MAGFEDLEDDIELPFEADLKPQEQPRKLSRLQKARNVGTPKLKGLDTPEGEARSFLPEAVLNEDEASSEDEEEVRALVIKQQFQSLSHWGGLTLTRWRLPAGGG